MRYLHGDKFTQSVIFRGAIQNGHERSWRFQTARDTEDTGLLPCNDVAGQRLRLSTSNWEPSTWSYPLRATYGSALSPTVDNAVPLSPDSFRSRAQCPILRPPSLPIRPPQNLFRPNQRHQNPKLRPSDSLVGSAACYLLTAKKKTQA